MPLYAGEAVVIKASALDPVKGEMITDAAGEVLLYAPPKNPKAVPADRVHDGDPIPMTYEAEIERYVAYVDTTGFAAGKWFYKVTLTGLYDTWEFGSFTLKA